MQRSALCRSRPELSNAYLLAKFGFGTGVNEPCKDCPLSVYRSLGSAELRSRIPPLSDSGADSTDPRLPDNHKVGTKPSDQKVAPERNTSQFYFVFLIEGVVNDSILCKIMQ